jgi:glycosyltransferase involved in cell wall biosynthesis
MPPITIVIICKNEIEILEETILVSKKLTNSIVVVDTGSTDGTLELLHKLNVKIIKSKWLGFGATKNIGINAAPNNWILSLDADEQLSEALINEIIALDLTNENVVYNIPFLNYFGKKPIRFGEWNNDYHIRLFNKINAQWNNAEVHEKLQYIIKPEIVKLGGKIHHKTVNNRLELIAKLDNYAKLNAVKLQTSNKKNVFFKKYFSPSFNFIKNYIFKLGFLDGTTGFIIAWENAKYTFNKYLYFEQLH